MPEPTIIYSEQYSQTHEIRVESYVKKYKSFLKQSGKSFVEQAKTIFEVEAELGQRYVESFYHQVGLDPHGTTVRKFKIIGKHSTRFEPHLDKIPNNWTTLYDLAKLSIDNFNKIVDEGLLTPFVTAKDIRASVRGKPDDRPKSRRAAVDLSAATDPRSLYSKLRSLADEFGVKLVIDPSLQRELDTPDDQQGAA